MSANNLRVVYNNLVDVGTTTVTASSSALSVSNLLTDYKSKVWRSSTCTTSAVKIFLKVILSSATIGAVILPFTNLTTAATIRIYGYTGADPSLGGTVDSPTFTPGGTLVFDTGAGVLACPYQSANVWNLGVTPIGTNTYGYGGGTYARAYIPLGMQGACTSLIIEINDTNAAKYIEASRLIIGQYWSPKYNTSFGLSAGIKDTSTSSRTVAGDLVSMRGPRFNTMNFDLKYMDTGDRSKLYELLRSGGIAKPLFISLFPENSADYDLEQLYQMYGKLSQLPGIQYANFLQYSSQLEMEEI